MDQTPGNMVRLAIQEALNIKEPAKRAFAITDILGVVQRHESKMKTTRREDLENLRPTHTLQALGDRVGLTAARVDQILRGK